VAGAEELLTTRIAPIIAGTKDALKEEEEENPKTFAVEEVVEEDEAMAMAAEHQR
jgi:hypothetical protein